MSGTGPMHREQRLVLLMHAPGSGRRCAEQSLPERCMALIHTCRGPPCRPCRGYGVGAEPAALHQPHLELLLAQVVHTHPHARPGGRRAGGPPLRLRLYQELGCACTDTSSHVGSLSAGTWGAMRAPSRPPCCRGPGTHGAHAVQRAADLQHAVEPGHRGALRPSHLGQLHAAGGAGRGGPRGQEAAQPCRGTPIGSLLALAGMRAERHHLAAPVACSWPTSRPHTRTCRPRL